MERNPYYQETVKQYYQKRKTIEIANRIKQGAEQEAIETILREGSMIYNRWKII
jgi:hypothetical protein